jgi:hypothetical protein
MPLFEWPQCKILKEKTEKKTIKRLPWGAVIIKTNFVM